MEGFVLVALVVVALIHSFLLIGLLRIVGDIAQKGSASSDPADQLVGRLAPDFSAPRVDGAVMHSSSLHGTKRVLLFVSPTCTSCTVTLAEIRGLLTKAAGQLLTVCRAQDAECAELASEYGDLPLLVDSDGVIASLYEITSVPSAVLIGADDRIRSYGYPDRSELEGHLSEIPPTMPARATI